MLLILNDVGTSELLLILVFILIFFGSKSIPSLARTLGRTIRQVKDASSEIQREITKSGGNIKKDLNLSGILQETEETVRRPLDQHISDLDEAIQYVPPNKNSHIQPIPPKAPEMEANPTETGEDKSEVVPDKKMNPSEHSTEEETKD